MSRRVLGGALLVLLLPLTGLPAQADLPAQARATTQAARDAAALERALATLTTTGDVAGEGFSINADVCPTTSNGRPGKRAGQQRKLVEHGRDLFFSATAFAQQPSQSPTRPGEVMSCATCHSGPGFTDGRDNLVGPTGDRDVAVRHTPHLLRLKDTAPYSWDGRFPCLQAVIKGAILADLEMNAARVPLQDELDALTAFVETLDVPDAVPGVDFDPAVAKIGRELFNAPRGSDPSGELTGGVSCATCHTGPALSDNKFHKILLPLFVTPVEPLDPGHVNADGEIEGFNTPVLRGLRFTAPYFHEGGAGDPTGTPSPQVNDPPRVALLEVVETYDRRFLFDFTPLEKLALVEFLLSL